MNSSIFKTAALAATTILFFSCDRTVSPERETSEQCEISVAINGINLETRSTDLKPTSDESRYRDATILVYGKDTGMLESYKEWKGSPVKFTLDKGEKVFYALLNAGSDIATKSGTVNDLLGNVATLKNDLSGFFMMGTNNVNVVDKSASTTITVTRAAAKISFEQVSLNFDSPALAALSFSIDAVMVINATGDISYNAVSSNQASYSPQVWYNKRNYTSGDCNKYLYDSSIARTLANGKSTTLGSVLYTYPNFTATDSHATQWSPRKTRVCLKCTLGTETVYYPLTLDTVGPNKYYTVKALTITKKGVSNPDDEWDDAESSGNIIIGDWFDGGDITETL